MKIDLNKYSVNKILAQKWYVEKGYKNTKSAISNMGIIYMVPCIVAAFWIGEATGWPEHVMESIKTLTHFYHYEEVANKPESYPGDL